jgi:hypothetical protein
LALTAILALVFICSGCKYKVELFPRDSGSATHITSAWIDSLGDAVSGDIELTIDGILYTGIYVSSPSDYGLTFLKQYCPQYGDMAKSTSERYGQAFLTAFGGKTLRCEYRGNYAKGGRGVCIDDEGRLYDMVISR